MEKIKIPGSVKIIGGCAFSGCVCLCDLKLETGLVYIDCEAFFASGVRNIEIPETVAYIGKRAFVYSSLKKVRFRGHAPAIDDGAFMISMFLVDRQFEAIYPLNDPSWDVYVVEGMAGMDIRWFGV